MRSGTGEPRGIGWLLGLLLLLGGSGCGGEERLDPPAPLLDSPSIDYPLALWDEGVEGTVRLRVRVDDTGAVDAVELLETSGHPDLDRAALEGAEALRFSPGRRGGRRVAVWAELPVQFSRSSGTTFPGIPAGEAPRDEAPGDEVPEPD